MQRLATSLFVVVALGVTTGACNPEPEYLGRRLSLWIRDLDDKADHDRERACEVVGGMGEAAAKAVPKLIERLADPAPAVREAAMRALAGVGAPSRPALEAKLTAESLELRAHVAQALVMIDKDHKQAIAMLVKAATSTFNTEAAGRGRAGLVLLGDRAVQYVLPMLDHAEVDVRLQGLRILSGLGTHGEAAMARVGEVAQKDSTPVVRRESLQTLKNIGAWADIEPLVRAATADKDDSVSTAAGFILNERLPAEQRPRVVDP